MANHGYQTIKFIHFNADIQMAAILLENSFLAGEDIALVETAEQRTTSIAKILVHPLEIMLQDPVLAIYLKEVMSTLSLI